jgi:glycosyltransferase involved in cell wall biosynthesis
VIPNAICVEDFSYHNTIDTSDFIIKYKLENTVPILFVGELSARKGIIYLIKAFSILNSIELGSKVKLLIVGSGDQLETIRKAIIEYKMEDTVIFLEKISFVDLIKAYKSSKMLIVPSLSEGLPTVILEAYYFGLPVIASDIPGIKDHFSESSLLVPPQDEQALADAIIRLLKDNELANRLSSTGKEKVINNYTWDKIIDEYLDLYTRLIQKNSH